ncbi:hypothetical protein [Adhaeribacter aquaticus]|uniref:hypothetical protein n=1 Tax=Adhaeribacter aquaticus TaxID=299567 RepID=UPI00040BE9E1|nr:hypothetical protein [Adhaeribacter aquaticus]
MRNSYLLQFSYFLCLGLSLSLTGCYNYYSETSQIGVLNDIPTVPHQNSVQVYFPGEYPEDQEYIKVKVLEVGGSNEYPTLVDGLKKSAQQNGMDAVLIIDGAQFVEGSTYHNRRYHKTNSPAYYQNTWTTSSLAGVGIKFKKNLNYFDRFVQRKTILLADSADKFVYKPYAAVEFGLNGKVQQSEWSGEQNRRNIDINYSKKYTYDFLVNDKNGWSYLEDEFGRVTKRAFQNGVIVAKLHYNDLNQVDYVVLKSNENYQLQKEKITFQFDSQNKVTGALVEKKGQLRNRHQFTYDENDRLIFQEIFQVYDKREQPFLLIRNDYFPKDYAYEPIVNP